MYSAAHKHAVTVIKGDTGQAGKTVTVYARGTYGDGGWPQIKLRINGVEYGPYTVNQTSYQPYGTANATLTGHDVVNVIYVNDSGSRQA